MTYTMIAGSKSTKSYKFFENISNVGRRYDLHVLRELARSKTD